MGWGGVVVVGGLGTMQPGIISPLPLPAIALLVWLEWTRPKADPSPHPPSDSRPSSEPPQPVSDRPSPHLPQVWRSIEEVAGQTDEQLRQRYCSASNSDPPGFVVPKLCLLYAVMERCQLERFRFKHAIGSCAGLLIAPAYWPE